MTSGLRVPIDVLPPPSDLTVSQWADKYRRLSAESSAEPGQWDTGRAEYQRGIMDALNDPGVETVVVMSSAQVGKTEIINNIVGYYINQDPSPILCLQPTLEMAKTWSKDRLAPMVRDTPVLNGKLKDPRSRDSENTLLHKKFPGGHITIAGANSAASLASRPIRIVLGDEVDRYPVSAGTEGDPVSLAKKRTTTFWNRKIVLTSTPTIKGASRIEDAFLSSDQRRYFVPCPHCGHCQVLKWGGPEESYGIKFDENWELQGYLCEACSVLVKEKYKLKMLAAGEWRLTAEAKAKKTVGFHLDELYSPWVSWQEGIDDFREKKKTPETLQTWVNTSRAETYEEKGEGVDGHILQERQDEGYNINDSIPLEILLITIGCDVQDDRLELEIVGWGEGEESWGLDYVVLPGSFTDEELWLRLDDERARRFTRSDGIELSIAVTFVDSGDGDHTDTVYRYARSRQRVYASKGQKDQKFPIIDQNKKKRKTKRGQYVPIGSSSAKDVIYNRLRFAKPGPGYCHFPEHYQPSCFDMLTSEEKRIKRVNGVPVKYWYLRKGRRNEALDCRVGALAALRFLSPKLPVLKLRLQREAEQRRHGLPVQQQPRRRVRSSGLTRT